MKDLSEQIIRILEKEGCKVPLSHLIKETNSSGNMCVKHNDKTVGVANEYFWQAMDELQLLGEITQEGDYELIAHDKFKAPVLSHLRDWLPLVVKRIK